MLFDVPLLGCAISATNAFVVPSLQWVAVLEGSKQRWRSQTKRFFREDTISAVCLVVREERASLLHGASPRLVAEQDFAIVSSVLGTLKVLSPLVRVLRIPKLILARERLWFDSCAESREGLWPGPLWWPNF